jgi:hypothetical protein
MSDSLRVIGASTTKFGAGVWSQNSEFRIQEREPPLKIFRIRPIPYSQEARSAERARQPWAAPDLTPGS